MSEEMNTTTFDEYAEAATETAIYPGAGSGSGRALSYVALGLMNEAGEVGGKIKKLLRDGLLNRDDIAAEVGDVLWYLAQLCNELDLSLGDVADRNVAKLQDRQARGVLGGSGDKR